MVEFGDRVWGHEICDSYSLDQQQGSPIARFTVNRIVVNSSK